MTNLSECNRLGKQIFLRDEPNEILNAVGLTKAAFARAGVDLHVWTFSDGSDKMAQALVGFERELQERNDTISAKNREIDALRRLVDDPEKIRRATQAGDIENRFDRLLDLVARRFPITATGEPKAGWRKFVMDALGVTPATFKRWEDGLALIPDDDLARIERLPVRETSLATLEGIKKGPRATPQRKPKSELMNWAENAHMEERCVRAYLNGMTPKYIRHLPGWTIEPTQGQLAGRLNNGRPPAWLMPECAVGDGDGPMSWAEAWWIGYTLRKGANGQKGWQDRLSELTGVAHLAPKRGELQFLLSGEQRTQLRRLYHGHLRAQQAARATETV